ncbi:PRTRC system protein B [Pedobacter sp. MC2016-24]|uniref:PRTRC system protein B n=1 Tax=Pedobacter sp. MC2016-24 TaxID=2780090 RepID=UPI00188082F7|nr:PRTRC system protein B [Pedobacter sp. MC2016-24]MBE9599866.1 PRTRC system protein B [Pedobacter sp. MC2016-24]
MQIINQLFKDVYKPVKAIAFYQSQMDQSIYAEILDMDATGQMINPHPLSVTEANSLDDLLNTSDELGQDFLMSKGLLPEHVLYINSRKDGNVIWFTPEMQVDLLFKPELTITDGRANVPPMVWKASRNSLSVYALSRNEKPVLDTRLCFAPFFNIYTDGRVCIGSVKINFDTKCSLEDFITEWQNYFFASTFSHLLGSVSPVKGNVIELWQKLVGSKRKFPLKQLKSTSKTLKSLIR